jgi:hypothetical protein
MGIVLKKQVLGVILIIIMALGLAGCNSAVTKGGQSEGKDVIPLIMLTSEPAGENDAGSMEREARLASWDLKSGKLSWEQEACFRQEMGEEYNPRLVWDGGSRLFACSFGSQETGRLIKGHASNLSVQEVRTDSMPMVAAIKASSEQDELLLAYPRSPSGESPDSSIPEVIVIESHRGDLVVKRELPLPDYAAKGDIMPLLISGNSSQFKLLLLNNDVEAGKNGLLLAKVAEQQEDWQKIKGEALGLIVGGGTDLAQVGSNIYRTIPEPAKLSLQQREPVWEEFSPLSDLQAGLSKNIEKAMEKYGDAYCNLRLGSFKDILLVAADLPEEHWIWAFRGDKCIGRLYTNNETQSMESSPGNEKMQATAFSARADWFILPTDGYGQYK